MVTHGQLFSQFDDHVLQVLRQALELLVGRLEEVRATAREETKSPPAVIRVPHHPENTHRNDRTKSGPSGLLDMLEHSAGFHWILVGPAYIL